MQRQLPDNQRCSKFSRAPMIAASWRHYSQNEQEALDRLKKDGTIIIKQADNGGAFVVMDKTYYIPHTKILAIRLVEMQSHDHRYFAYHVKWPTFSWPTAIVPMAMGDSPFWWEILS